MLYNIDPGPPQKKYIRDVSSTRSGLYLVDLTRMENHSFQCKRTTRHMDQRHLTPGLLFGPNKDVSSPMPLENSSQKEQLPQMRGGYNLLVSIIFFGLYLTNFFVMIHSERRRSQSVASNYSQQIRILCAHLYNHFLRTVCQKVPGCTVQYPSSGTLPLSTQGPVQVFGKSIAARIVTHRLYFFSPGS